MIIKFYRESSYRLGGGFERWVKHSVVPGDGAFARGLPYLRANEPVIFKTAGFLNAKLPGMLWAYTQHPNGAFHLNPENGNDYIGISPEGYLTPLSREAAGMAWSYSAFWSLGLSLRRPESSIYQDKANELQRVIAHHPEMEAICYVHEEHDWSTRNG